MTTSWHPSDVATIDEGSLPEIAHVDADDARPALPHLHLWDHWPVVRRDGSLAEFDGTTLWMVLASPSSVHPDDRHDVARIRLVMRKAPVWHDCGDLLPDDLSPGTREWAGSAVIDDDDNVTLYYTVTGRRGAPFSYEQRMFETHGRLDRATLRMSDWTAPFEILDPDPRWYMDTRSSTGGAGLIKAFRDPGYFNDPADGTDYLVFTGSNAKSGESHNGNIGIARRSGSGWHMLPPLIDGDGLNNEFERPHVLFRDGWYYVFWSTQRHVFAPGGPSGPNGLYGMASRSMAGPWMPLNGTGLVAANPAAEPSQTYSWIVLPNLIVVSFIDLWGMAGRTRESHPETRSSQFGGTFAPPFRLALDGERTSIIGT